MSDKAMDNYETAFVAPVNNRSHVAGEKSGPLKYLTIPETLRETVIKYGHRDAVVFPSLNLSWSYDDLDREIDACASGLRALGLQKGDRIGIWSPNNPEWLLMQFSTARIGLILVNINPAYRLS
ncbi:MAG: AMP-binding protein, partial [Sneathiella sp.]